MSKNLIPTVGYVRMSSGKQEASPAQQQAETLEDVVGFFKIGVEHRARPVPRFVAKAAPTRAAGGNGTVMENPVRQQRDLVVRHATANGTNGAAATAEALDDDWQEF